MHKSLNILKTNEWSMSKGLIVWYVNQISINLIMKKHNQSLEGIDLGSECKRKRSERRTWKVWAAGWSDSRWRGVLIPSEPLASGKRLSELSTVIGALRVFTYWVFRAIPWSSIVMHSVWMRTESQRGQPTHPELHSQQEKEFKARLSHSKPVLPPVPECPRSPTRTRLQWLLSDQLLAPLY